MTALAVDVTGPLRMRSGQTALLPVRLRNDAGVPLDVSVSAIGLDHGWSDRPERCGPLTPGESVTLDVPVTVPPGSPPGSFPFVVSVQPLHTVTGAAVGDALHVDAVVVVGDASKLAVSLSPREPRGVRSRHFSVVLDNRTAEPLHLSLQAQTSRGLFIRMRRSEVDLPAGAAAKVRVRALVQRRLLGQPRRLPFVITAQGHTTPVRLEGVFVARPLLGTAMTRVIAVASILAVWAGITFLAVGRISGLAHHHSSTVVAQSGTGDGEQADGGSADGGDVTTGRVKGVSTGSLVAGGRINGVVTGPAPAGVRVTLAPTSLVDEAAEGATFVGATPPAKASLDGKLPAALVRYEAPHALRATRSTVSQADGSWAFANVTTQGYYLLTFSKPGYQTRRYVLSQDPGKQLEPLTVPLASGSGHLTGLVSAGGAPAPGARVTITDGTVTVSTTTPTQGHRGQWRVDGLSTPGTYLVSAAGAGLATSSRLVSLIAGGSSDGVDLSLARGVEAVVGQVDATTDTGTTIDAGGVTVTVSDGTTTRTATTVSRATDGGASQPVGAFTLSDLPLGQYTVSFAADGYMTRTQNVLLDGKGSQVKVVAHLAPAGASVGGTVTDGPDGAGLVGAGLVLTGDSGTYKLTSADGGSFAVAGVVPGSYVLAVEKYGFTTAYAAVEAVAGQPATVHVALVKLLDTGIAATSHIRGRVVDARNGGAIVCPTATPACITVRTVDARDPGPDLKASAPVLPAAEYVLPEATAGGQGLLPGLHVLTVDAPGYESTTISVQVPLGGFANAPLVALHPKVGITGKITPGAPAALPATCVIAAPFVDKVVPAVTGCTPVAATATDPATCAAVPPQPGGGCAVVDATGSYELSGLPHSGSYYVFVVPTDTAKEWVPIAGVPMTLASGETKRYDATMSRKGRIHLLLRLPTSGNGLQAPTAPVTVTALALDPVTLSPASTPASTVTTTNAALGEAMLTGLADGKYLLRASGKAISGSATDYLGTISLAEAGTNQTAEATVVMTVVQPNVVTGRVVWTQDSSLFGVAGAVVKVRGVTSYSGTSQVPGEVQVTTDSNGCFAVTADGSSPATLPSGCTSALTSPAVKALHLVTPDITLDADATPQGFGTRVVTTDTGAPVIIGVGTPTLPFTGALQIDGGAKTTNFSRAVVRVTTSAIGAGDIVIAPNAAGQLSWRDTSTGNVVNRVHPGTYALTASLPGYDDVSGTLTCLLDAVGHAANTAAPCDITLSLGSHITFTVTVTNTNGTQPVYGAVVTLAGGNVATTTVAAPPGSNTVAFPDLSAAAGSFTLAARAPGYAQSGALAQAALVAGTDRSVEIRLDRLGVISGRVLGAIGAQTVPLAGVSVSASDGKALFTGATTGDGTYRITGTTDVDGLPLDPAKTWTVTATAPSGSGYIATSLATAVAGQFPVGATTDAQKTLAGVDLTLTADPVELDITVDDDTGSTTHLTNAVVSVTGPSGSPVFATANASSVYPFPGLVPTVYTVQVSAPNHSPLTTTVALQPGVPKTAVRIVLADRRNAIAVHVLAQTGTAPAAPLAGATVTITDSTGTVVGTLTTSSSGDAQQSGLDEGAYVVDISGGGTYTTVQRSLTLASGQLAAVEATLQKLLGQVVVTVKSATSTSPGTMAGASVSLVAVGSGAISQAAQEADASGVTTFNQVTPGTYRINTTGPAGHLPGSAALTVSGGNAAATVTVDEHRLDLRLRTSPTASPDPTATVTVTPVGTSAPVVTETVVADNTTRPIYVPSGSYTVSATSAGYDQPSILLGPTDSTANLTLTKTSTGALDISVTAAGSGAVNAQITVEGDPTVYSTGPANADVLVSNLSTGNHDVTVRLVDGRSLTTAQAVSLNTTTNVTVAVPAAVTGSVAVTIKRGTVNLSGAVVTLSGLPDAQTTGGSGTVSFPGVEPGAYTVTAADSGGVTLTAGVTVTAGATAAVTITFPAPAPTPASLTVQVTNGGINVSGATVSISGPGGPLTGVTPTSGAVTFSGLDAGTYNVAVTTPDGLEGNDTQTLTAGQNATLPVSVAYIGRVKVTARHGGDVVDQAAVTVTGLSNSCMTDTTSSCTLTGLPSGTYTVAVLWNDKTVNPHVDRSGSATVTVTAGTLATVTITLSP